RAHDPDRLPARLGGGTALQDGRTRGRLLGAREISAHGGARRPAVHAPLLLDRSHAPVPGTHAPAAPRRTPAGPPPLSLFGPRRKAAAIQRAGIPGRLPRVVLARNPLHDRSR